MTTVQMILDALKRLAGSMKAWTMVLGLLTALGAKYGFNVDPATFWVIVGGFATLLGAQGATDWGKNASLAIANVPPMMLNAATTASPIVNDANRISTNGDGSVHVVFDNGASHDITGILAKAGYAKVNYAKVATVPQSGFAALWLMAILTIVGVGAIIVALASCTAAQKADVKTVENNAIACAKTEFYNEVIPVATILITHPSDTGTQLDKIGLQSGSSVLACALKTVLDVLTVGTGHAAPSQAVLVARDYIANHNYHYVGE